MVVPTFSVLAAILDTFSPPAMIVSVVLIPLDAAVVTAAMSETRSLCVTFR